MNVLVSGGSGYVGSVLVPMLAKAHRVRVVETMAFGNPIEGLENVEFVKADITSQKAMWDAMRGTEAVVHLAGVVTDDLVDMNKDYGYKVNVLATRYLAETAWARRVKVFVYASSSSVYGHAAEKHERVTEDVEPEPQTAYASQKYEAEKYIRADRTVIVRSATCCGPAPRMRLDTVVNVFSKQAYFDGKITVHGGEQYRSNVHVQDVANFYRHALESEIQGVFNVTCDNMTVRGIAGEVAGAALAFGIPKVDVEVQPVPDPRSYRLDATKAKATGWKPERSIWQAAMDNFEWFKAGGVKDPNSDIYYNTRRMKEKVRAG